nr:IS5 family transposase [Phyllobacterium phragmitis]
MGERVGLTDEEWVLISLLLPAERGRGCRPAQDNRRYFEGMMWMARTGAQWRHLPNEYGKWNSVFRRYRRWVETGVFEAMLETLAELVERDRSADMIDSTVIRGTPLCGRRRVMVISFQFSSGQITRAEAPRASLERVSCWFL